MNEFEKSVQKLKFQIEAYKLKREVKKGLENVKETIENLQESANAFIKEQKAKSQMATEEDWVSILKNDLKDGWDEIEETAKDTWNSIMKKRIE